MGATGGKWGRRLAAAGSATALVAACGSPQPAAGGPPTAVASVFPLAWITGQIAPDADLTVLGEQGAEPHDLELTPSQRQQVETADVIVYMGDIDFQPQVEDAIGVSGGQVVSVAQVIGDNALLAGAAHVHEGATAVEAAGEPGAAGKAGAVVDPHVWFDAGLMARVARQIGDAFATADPDGAQGYRDRAAALAGQLESLDGEVSGMLSGCALDEAIVSHEAYAYLLSPQGLSQHGIAGRSPEAGASPAELAALIQEIRAADISAVLAEPVEGRSDAEALAQETGVRLLEINSLEVVTDQQARTGYPALLRRQAQTFATALQCAGA